MAVNSVPETLQELRDLVVAYAKQETIDPLRNLGRFVGFGLGAVTLFCIGTLFLAMSLLRGLQTLTGDVFVGFWSWVPYLIVALALVGVGAAVVPHIGKGGLGTAVDPSPRKAS